MKTPLLLILIFTCLSLISQEKLSKKAFEEYAQPRFTTYTSIDVSNPENYSQKIAILEEVLDKYHLMSEEDQKNMLYIPSSIYYDLACYNSLQENKEDALINLEEAVKLGYSDYNHMKTDSDLNSLHSSQRYIDLLQSITEKGDYLNILRKAGDYIIEEDSSHPKWEYQEADAPELAQVRNYFNLDSIVNGKEELDQIITLLKWVHDEVSHDGMHNARCDRNAISIYDYSKKENRGVNCRLLAIMLNECYLSLGFKSRFVTCLPKNRQDQDCHVINSVYSKTLNKWIWIDPTNNAYVKDESGNFLSISEVRKSLIENKTLILNEDANWNNKVKQTKEKYLENYMAKNLYRLSCALNNKYNGDHAPYVILYPSNHDKEEIIESDYITFDESYFWEE